MTFGAGLLTARERMRLKRTSSGAAAQERTFSHLTSWLSGGSVWRRAGLERGMDYEAFRERVPLQTYESLAHPIERMKNGHSDVLCPGECALYAVSSGTTAGRTKFIPVNGEMLAHFRKAGLDSMLWYAARSGGKRVFKGRHLFLGGSSALAPIPESAPFEARSGDLSGIAALNLPGWVESHLFEPGAQIAQMTDWPSKIRAIAERTVEADITLMAGMPTWTLIAAEAIRALASSRRGEYLANLQEVWPGFECFVHGGVPIGPFQDELRAALGPTVNFHEVYPASEGFIAAQDADASYGLRLMAGAGLFFEFLPLSQFDESRLPSLGGTAVPLSDVRPGIDYALVLTTPAGLARYVIGDVVRFVSTEPPRLIYVGRTKLQLSAFGEHVIEKDLTDALLAVCRRNGWTITSFHVAPMFSSSTTGRSRGRHEWWIELKAGTLMTPTGPIMAGELDRELMRLNDDYEAKRLGGALEPPFVRLVMPGVFEHWMRHHGKWGGQNKMPRCRSDRLIADELGNALQFAKD